MSDWRPIETAPRDGTPILIVCAEDGEIEITEWCIIQRGHYKHVHQDLYRYILEEPLEFWNGNGHRATHWMPLPAPPEQ